MKLHLTPLSLSPTIQGLPLVVYFASKVEILDALRGFLGGLCCNIAQATLILKYNYFKITFCLFWGVFCVIVLLRDPLLLLYFQLCKAFHCSILLDFITLFCICIFLNLNKLPHPIWSHATYTTRLFSPLCLIISPIIWSDIHSSNISCIKIQKLDHG